MLTSRTSGRWRRPCGTSSWRPTPGCTGRSNEWEQPFHEIGQIFEGAAEMGFDVSIFRTSPPSWDEIVAVRAERQQSVTGLLATVTPEQLDEERENPWGGD